MVQCKRLFGKEKVPHSTQGRRNHDRHECGYKQETTVNDKTSAKLRQRYSCDVLDFIILPILLDLGACLA